jgi:hypothetical protein
MKKKIFTILILCCVLLPICFFSAYSISANINGSYEVGFRDGNATGFIQGNNIGSIVQSREAYKNGLAEGYKEGFIAAQNQTSP